MREQRIHPLQVSTCSLIQNLFIGYYYQHAVATVLGREDSTVSTVNAPPPESFQSNQRDRQLTQQAVTTQRDSRAVTLLRSQRGEAEASRGGEAKQGPLGDSRTEVTRLEHGAAGQQERRRGNGLGREGARARGQHQPLLAVRLAQRPRCVPNSHWQSEKREGSWARRKLQKLLPLHRPGAGSFLSELSFGGSVSMHSYV